MRVQSHMVDLFGAQRPLGVTSLPGVATRGVKNHPLALKIHIFQDIKLKVGIQAAEWIESHMLEISYSYGAQGTPGALWRKGVKSHFDHP